MLDVAKQLGRYIQFRDLSTPDQTDLDFSLEFIPEGESFEKRASLDLSHEPDNMQADIATLMASTFSAKEMATIYISRIGHILHFT